MALPMLQAAAQQPGGAVDRLNAAVKALGNATLPSGALGPSKEAAGVDMLSSWLTYSNTEDESERKFKEKMAKRG